MIVSIFDTSKDSTITFLEKVCNTLKKVNLETNDISEIIYDLEVYHSWKRKNIVLFIEEIIPLVKNKIEKKNLEIYVKKLKIYLQETESKYDKEKMKKTI